MKTPPDAAVPQDKLQTLRYTVSIYDEDTVLTDHENGGKQFLVSHEQLMNFFRSEVTFRPEKNLLWMKTDGLATTYLLNFPKQKQARMIFLNQGKKTRQLKIRFPGLLFRATVREGKLSDLCGWCYAGRLRKDSALYEIPLPNISGSHICLGGIDKKVENSVREAVERAFFDTPFNNHNFYVTTRNIAFTDFHRQYNGEFPWRILKKIGIAGNIL